MPMAAFGGKDPQRFFAGTNFTVDEVLYEPPALVPAPSIYLDRGHHRWAVRLSGASPRIYSFEDVLACRVADDDGAAERTRIEREGSLASLAANPMRYSQANASKRGDRCFSLGVIIAVHGADVTIQLPYITRPTRRSSPVYHELRAAADHVKETFDAMIVSARTAVSERSTEHGAAPDGGSSADKASSIRRNAQKKHGRSRL